MPHLEGARHSRVSVRGAELHLAELGEGDDVVLCLHGWPQHWWEWRALMPALADAGHRVIALDQRGFGWSDAPADGYEKEALADDVLAVLDHLGLERVKLVGHDWGGWIGFLLCLKAPERFEKYLALNILPPWTSQRAIVPQLWRFWYQWLILAPVLGYRMHTSGQLVPKTLVGGSVNRSVWDRETLAAFGDTFQEPARAMAAVHMYRTFNLKEAPEIAAGRYAKARLEVPTRMLFGTGDTALRPETLAGWQKHAPEMELELVEGCGHFIVDEAPELVAKRAREFFA
jgi:pimeloyl-ACP methyl ester carboxylesterase